MVIKRYSVMGFIIAILFLFIGIVSLYTGSFSLFFWDFQEPKPYNVIMISIDTLRADHLGAYGYSRDTSPNLDRFAEESILFEQAIAQADFTLASHASLFTSQYLPTHGVINLESTLSPSKIILPEVLKQAGYKTAAFVGGGEMSAYFGFSQGFDVYTDQRGAFFNATIPPAIEWLKKNKDSKFFLHVQGFDVHAPYHEKFGQQFESVFDREYDGILSDHTRFFFNPHSKGYPTSITHLIQKIEDEPSPILEDETIFPTAILHLIKKVDGKVFLELENETIPLTQQDINHIIAHYDNGVLAVDSVIQQFLETLKAMGMYENSIIVIFAGHGESLGDNMGRPLDNINIMERGPLYDELIRVPLIIRHPAYETQRISTQVQLIDLFPTILDFLKIPMSGELKNQIQGNSVVPLVEGRVPKDFNEYVYGQSEAVQDIIFVRSSKWKLMSWPGNRFILYNLEDNPEETRNVIDKYPKITEKLKQKLQEWNMSNIEKRSQLKL